MRIDLLASALAVGLVLAACDSGSNSPTSEPGLPPSSPEIPVSSVKVGVDTSFDLAADQKARFVFLPAEKTTYVIETTGGADTRLELRDSSSKVVLAMDAQPDSTNGRIVWTSTSSLPLSVVLEAAIGGRLTLRIARKATTGDSVPTGGRDAFESDSTLSAAKRMAADGSTQARTLTAGDVDWIRIPVVAGKYYLVEASSDTALRVGSFSADSLPLATPSRSPHVFLARTTCEAYVRIGRDGSTGTAAYSIRAVVDSISYVQTEPNHDRSAAVEVATDGIARKFYLPAKSLDWFKFRVDSGKSYRVVAKGSLPVDVDCRLDSNDYRSVSATEWLVFKATRTTTILGNIEEAWGAAKLGGAYEIKISVDTADIDAYEPDDRPAQATEIVVGGVARKHRLQAGESDWFWFQADSGESYSVQRSFLDHFAITSVFDDTARGKVVSGGSWVGIKAKASGRLWVSVGADAHSLGPYTIEVLRDTSTDAHEPDDTWQTAHPIVVDAPAQSPVLKAGDVDWMKFEVDSGKSYVVELAARQRPFYYVGATLYARDAKTTALTQLDHEVASIGASARITFRAASTGTYYIEADVTDHSAYSHAYSIQVTTIRP